MRRKSENSGWSGLTVTDQISIVKIVPTN